MRVATIWIVVCLVAVAAVADDQWYSEQSIKNADPTGLCTAFNTSAHYSIFAGTGYQYKATLLHPARGIGYITLTRAQFNALGGGTGRAVLERTAPIRSESEAKKYAEHLRSVAAGISMPYWLGALGELPGQAFGALSITNTLLSLLEGVAGSPRAVASDLAPLMAAGGEFQQFAVLRGIGDGRYVLNQTTSYRVRVGTEVRNYAVCSQTAAVRAETENAVRPAAKGSEVDRATWNAAAWADLAASDTAAETGRLRYAVEVYKTQPRRRVEEVAAVLRNATLPAAAPYVGPVAASRVAAALVQHDLGIRREAATRIARALVPGPSPFSTTDAAALLRIEPYRPDELRTVAQQTLDEAWTLARANHRFRTLVEHEFDVFSESPARSARDILAHRDLGLPPAVVNSLASGQIPDKETLIGAFVTGQGDVFKSLTNARADLVALDRAHTSAELDAIVRARDIGRNIRDTTALLQTADGRVALTANLARLIGAPDLARQIEAVGAAAIQVTRAVSTFRQTLSGTASVSAMGSAMLSGNCIIAASTLALSLLDRGPTPEQMTMDQLTAIREQIQQLSVEMHDRFDRVDAQLNAIMSALNQNFGALFEAVTSIAAGVADIQGSVTRIETSLAQLQANVVRLEFRIRRYVVAGFDRPVRENLLRCLDYDRQFPGVGMSEQTFRDCLFKFYSHAMIDAMDPLAVSRGASVRDDASIMEVLDSYDALSSIEFLHNVIRYESSSDLLITATGLPSGSEWAIAADAYASMLSKYPQHVRAAAPVQINTLLQLGDSLENAIDALDARTAVVPAATRYSKALDKVKDALLKEEQDYRAAHMSGLPFDATTADVKDFVPASLRPGYLPPCAPANIAEQDANRREGIVTGSASIRLPSVTPFIPGEMLLAERLGLGSINACYYTYGFTEAHSTSLRPPASGFVRPVFVNLYEHLRVGIDGVFTAKDGTKTQFFRRILQPAETVLWATKHDDGSLWPLLDALGVLNANWEGGWNLNARFVSGSAEQLSAQVISDARSAVQKNVADALQGHRAALFTTLGRDFEQMKELSLYGRALDARLAILTALCTVGLSRDLLADDALAGYISGANRLSSSATIQRALMSRLTEGVALASLLDEQTAKAAAFNQLANRLAAATPKRGHAVISRSLDSLRAAAALVANVSHDAPHTNNWALPEPGNQTGGLSAADVEQLKKKCRTDADACVSVAQAALAACGERPSATGAEAKWLTCAEAASCWTGRAAALNRVEESCIAQNDRDMCRAAGEALRRLQCGLQ